jgi:hypothetical protein
MEDTIRAVTTREGITKGLLSTEGTTRDLLSMEDTTRDLPSMEDTTRDLLSISRVDTSREATVEPPLLNMEAMVVLLLPSSSTRDPLPSITLPMIPLMTPLCSTMP